MRALFRASPLALWLVVLGAPACKEQKDETPPPPAALPPPAAPIPSATAPAPEPAPPAAPAPPKLLSAVIVRDEAVAKQLVHGFYSVEDGSWRWTEQSFGVKLAVPPGAAEKGALLRLNFSLPKAAVAQRPSVGVTGKVAESSTSKTFTKVGEQKLELVVPPAALAGESVVADFTVDKPFAPGGGDTRALGVVVVSVELVVK